MERNILELGLFAHLENKRVRYYFIQLNNDDVALFINRYTKKQQVEPILYYDILSQGLEPITV